MAATIKYMGKWYFVLIQDVTQDVVLALWGGKQKNFTRAFIEECKKGWITE